MKREIFKILFYTGISIAALLWLSPILMLCMAAVRDTSEFYAKLNLFSLPQKFSPGNFARAWGEGELSRYFINGLLVTCIKVPSGILISSMCAFALTRLKMKGKDLFFSLILLGMMLPIQLTLIPLNTVYARLRLINTYYGLIFAYIGFGIPLGVLVFRGFFRSIPKELDEAAYIDGCGKWRLFFSIILPISKPAIVTILILDFLNTWNEFLVQSVLITKDSMKTIPYGLLSFVGEFTTDYGLLSAGVLLSIIPVFIVYLIFQRHFVEGVSGALKG